MVSRARFLVVAALAAGDVTGKPATARIGGLFPMFLSEVLLRRACAPCATVPLRLCAPCRERH